MVLRSIATFFILLSWSAGAADLGAKSLPKTCVLDSSEGQRTRLEPFAEPIPAAEIEAELEHITEVYPENLLLDNKNWKVVVFTPGDPKLFDGFGQGLQTLESQRARSKVMREVARLREITFWEVGEGTGRAYDWDNFDNHYSQIVVYNKKKRKIAGGERLAFVDEVLRDPELGMRAIYPHMFYNFAPEYYSHVQTRYSYNVGRTFVTKEFRGTLAFHFIFYGVAQLLKQKQNVLAFDGVASISGRYTAEEQKLISAFFAYNYSDQIAPGGLNLSRWIRPIEEVNYDLSALLADDILLSIVKEASEESKVSSILGQLDLVTTDGGPPPLFKTYGNLKSRVVGASIDREFNTIDILLYVVASQIPLPELERYFGAEGALQFQKDKAALEIELEKSLAEQPIFEGRFDINAP